MLKGNYITPLKVGGTCTTEVALECWSTGPAINPAPGVSFITKFISLDQVPPIAQYSLKVQNRDLKHLSFHFTPLKISIHYTKPDGFVILEQKLLVPQSYM